VIEDLDRAVLVSLVRALARELIHQDIYDPFGYDEEGVVAEFLVDMDIPAPYKQ